MGQTLTHGVYLPNEGERNCYSGLASNWRLLDGAIGTVAAHTTAIAGKADISHTHGNITNDGKVGTTANLPLITGTDGAVQAGSFGNTANTFCEGNDSRLSDARTPVAHTHTKSDVTDLLNSDFIPASDANYTLGSSDLKWKQIWCSGYKTKSGNIDFTDSTTTGAAQSWWIDTMEKNGTDFFGVGSIRYHSAGLNEEHFRIKNAGGKWADLYIQLGDNNQFTVGTSTHSDVTNNGFRGKFTPLDSFIPNANNSYDLGSSSYQWNNLYAKNYFYNGVAWGLDKANVWSNVNTFSNTLSITGNTLFAWDRPQVTIGTIPSSIVFYGTTRFRDSNNTSYAFERGAISTTWNYRQWFVHNFSNASINASFEIGIKHDGTEKYFLIDADKVIPNTTGVSDLGTSDKKWKSLNGINPGALSLPDNSGYTNISGNITDLTGAVNSYTPPSDGYVMVNVNPDSNNYAYVSLERVTVRSSSETTSGKNAMATIPVIGGKSIDISVIGASIAQARFTPCLGNV